MDKPLSRAIKKVQQKKKLSEVSPAMIAVAQGAQTLATVAMKAAKGEKAGPEARRMAMTHQMATKTVNASYNYDIDEVAFIPALAKGALMIGKAAVKGAAAAAKGVAKGAKVASKVASKGAKVASKGAKVATKTGEKMAKTGTNAVKTGTKQTPNVPRRNVKSKRFRKFEKDDKGNIVRGKKFDQKFYDQEGNKKTQGYMGAMDGPDKSVSFDREMRQRKKEDDAEKKAVQSVKKGVKQTGEVAKSTGRKVKRGISTTSKAFGSSSFAKEGITFKEYLNKL